MINNTLNKTPARGQPGWIDPIRGPRDRRAPNPNGGDQTTLPQPAPVASSIQQQSPVKGLLAPQGSLNYSGLVGSLASAANPNATQTGLLKKTTQAAEGNTRIGKQAQSIADLYAPEIGRVGGLGASAQAGYGSTGSNVVGAGNAAIASQSASQRMSALSQAEQAQLLGTQQQLTAQGQLQSGYNNALGASNTQQAQQLSGLGAAAGYAQPSPAGFGQTTFNPLTGGYEGSSGLPQEVLQQYASLAANGQYAAIPSSITGNPVLSAQLNALASQMNPNYTPVGSQAQGNVLSTNIQNLGTAQTAGQAQGLQAQFAAPGQATASNIQTAGTAFTGAANTGYQGAVQQYVAANTAYKQAQGQAKNLKDSMAGINGLDNRYANTVVNGLRNQFGDAKYTSFVTSLAEAQQAYTSLLASVGASTPTVNGEQATAILSGSHTPAQIKAAIDALDKAAFAKLNPLYQQLGQYQKNLGASSGGGSSSIYNF